MIIDISKLQELKFFDVKDPFKWEYFESVDIHMTKAGVMSATLYWQNGPTGGHHDITAYSMDDFNEQLFSLIDSMKAQDL
jgi:hypothetical protein